MLGWGLVTEILVIVGSTGVLGVVIKAWIDRNKLRADTDSVQVNTALAQMSQAVADVARVRAELLEVKEEQRKVRRAVMAHEVWDRKVMREFARQGIEIEPPPELFWV